MAEQFGPVNAMGREVLAGLGGAAAPTWPRSRSSACPTKSGEAPVARVVTGNRDLTLGQLNAFAKESLARYKRELRSELRGSELKTSGS